MGPHEGSLPAQIPRLLLFRSIIFVRERRPCEGRVVGGRSDGCGSAAVAIFLRLCRSRYLPAALPQPLSFCGSASDRRRCAERSQGRWRTTIKSTSCSKSPILDNYSSRTRTLCRVKYASGSRRRTHRSSRKPRVHSFVPSTRMIRDGLGCDTATKTC